MDEFDKSKFGNTPYQRRVEKPWGYEIIFTPPDSPYTGKILHIEAGRRLSLQVHDEKTETLCLIKGKCLYISGDCDGRLVEIGMEPMKGYTVALGQKHRLCAIEDSDVFEASTPERGNTLRLQDDDHRGTETEKMREEPNRGWGS